MTEIIDMDSVDQQIAQSHKQLDQIKYWSISQAADFRAKAELLRELDGKDIEIEELDCVPGTPTELEAKAEDLDRVAKRVNR